MAANWGRYSAEDIADLRTSMFDVHPDIKAEAMGLPRRADSKEYVVPEEASQPAGA